MTFNYMHLLFKDRYLTDVDLLRKTRLALNCKADVNERDKWGRGPLYYAAVEGNVDIMELLIQRGADLQAKDVNGLTALHASVIHGRSEATNLLLSYGADRTERDKWNRTPLSIPTAPKMSESITSSMKQSHKQSCNNFEINKPENNSRSWLKSLPILIKSIFYYLNNYKPNNYLLNDSAPRYAIERPQPNHRRVDSPDFEAIAAKFQSCQLCKPIEQGCGEPSPGLPRLMSARKTTPNCAVKTL